MFLGTGVQPKIWEGYAEIGVSESEIKMSWVAPFHPCHATAPVNDLTYEVIKS